METMDKELTVSKMVLIIWPKMPQVPQDLFYSTDLPNWPKKVEKRLH
jgi:hypothetical protein